MTNRNFLHMFEPPESSSKAKKSAENADFSQPQHADTNTVAPAVQRALANPSSDNLTPDVIQSLQATHGNSFVNGLVNGGGNTTHIQAKLEVTPANDQYEQEADAVAKEVVQKMDAPVQRQDEEEELQMKRIQRQDEEEELQMKRIQRQDEEEELQMKRIQREDMDEEELQMKRIQRQDEEEELQMKRIQRASSEDGFEVGGEIEESIQNASGGMPIQDDVRGPLESAFGADFSDVRVHTGSQANDLNSAVQAKAFTHGGDIFFREGAYQPGSSDGKELLAHELTHVVQQGSAKPLQQKADDKD